MIAVNASVDMQRLREMYLRSGKVPDLKPLYGAMFHDLLLHYTHWVR